MILGWTVASVQPKIILGNQLFIMQLDIHIQCSGLSILLQGWQ
jgi:hypothetical protein